MTGLIQQSGHEVTDGRGLIGDAKTAEFEIVIPSELEKIMKKYGLEIEVIGKVSIRLSSSPEVTPSSEPQARLTAFRQSSQPGVCAKISGMTGQRRSGSAVFSYPINGNGHTAQEAVTALIREMSGKTVSFRREGRGVPDEIKIPNLITNDSSNASPGATAHDKPGMGQGG